MILSALLPCYCYWRAILLLLFLFVLFEHTYCSMYVHTVLHVLCLLAPNRYSVNREHTCSFAPLRTSTALTLKSLHVTVALININKSLLNRDSSALPCDINRRWVSATTTIQTQFKHPSFSSPTHQQLPDGLELGLW